MRAPVSLAIALLSLVAATRPSGAQEVEAIEPNRGGTMTTEARDPSYALSKLHPAEGYRVELWASEQDFPLHNPVSFTFDARGRMWVAIMPTYPQRLPDEEPNDKILILEDTDGDGRADRHTVFADGLHLPTGFELGDGGAYVAQQPNLMFLQDTDGDDRADVREIVLHGFGTEDSHHSISAFTWGPGGALYFQEGTFHHSQVETPWGPVRLVNAGVFRYAPQRHWLEVFVSYPFANPWGHVFDRWGQNFIADASGGANYFGTAITGNAPYPEKRRPMKVFTSVVRPTAGCEFVSSRHFPDEAQGNFLVNNTIGFQGIKQHRVIEDGSGFTSEEVEPLLYSTDINFRPVDLQFGPDGALYLVDWFNPLVGHMQYSLRDERRDHGHGRIWRVVHATRPLLDPPEIAEASIDQLLDLLKTYEDRTRYRVRRELRTRDRSSVLDALPGWLDSLDRRDPEIEHHRLEALWLYQSLDRVEPDLLGELLRSPEPRTRAAATRVARFWRDRLDDSQDILERRLHDEFPRTRLEALLGLSYLPSARSAKAALDVLDHETDYYLDYGLGETMRTLRSWWQPGLQDGSLVTELSEPGAQWLLAQLDTSELSDLPLGPRTAQALLARADAPPERQLEAAALLARGRLGGREAELLEALQRADAAAIPERELLESLGERLLELEESELTAIREPLEELARNGSNRTSRVDARTALLLLDTDVPDRTSAEPMSESTVEWLEAIAALPAPERATHYAEVLQLAEGARSPAPVPTRYVRLEIPDRGRTLSVAEVEVFAGGENVALAARGASATQSGTAYRGVAERAIDGSFDGSWEGHTFTTRDDHPWLEIDLGQEMPVDWVAVTKREYNANNTQAPIDDLRVVWLDQDRRVVERFEQLEWRGRRGEIEPAGEVRRAALRALSGMPVEGARSFEALADAATAIEFRSTALRGLRQLTAQDWSESQWAALSATTTVPLAGVVASWLGEIPIASLTSDEVEGVFAFGAELATRLPSEPDRQIDSLRTILVERAVTQVVIRAVPHQMIFDVTSFSVRAGRPVEILLENPDVMPHNVVVTAIGALEDVGRMAEAMAEDDPIAAERRQYVPGTGRVLWATGLVQPGESMALSFVAPGEPGNYPFVCTFPGHWILMNGIMRVLGDDSAEIELTVTRREVPDDSAGALASAAIANSRGFVKDWTIDELLPDVQPLATRERPSTESLRRGGELFVEAGCNKCHIRGGTGGQVGPELDTLHERYDAVDTLAHIIEPSQRVEPRYEATWIETVDGLFYSGQIVDQDDQAVRIRANPLDPEDVTTVAREEILSMERSELSTMPTGLLSTLRRDEILDLLRWLLWQE